jgi:hypothetical protein
MTGIGIYRDYHSGRYWLFYRYAVKTLLNLEPDCRALMLERVICLEQFEMIQIEYPHTAKESDGNCSQMNENRVTCETRRALPASNEFRPDGSRR